MGCPHAANAFARPSGCLRYACGVHLRRVHQTGRLPAPLRAQLEPEGTIHVAERVRVRQQFSGSIPGMVSGWGVNRHLGLMVLTRERLFALLPSIPRLKGPAIDAWWDAEQHGPPQSRSRKRACGWTSM